MRVHGANITQKEKHKTKYLDAVSRTYLTEIRKRYDEWYQVNLGLVGPGLTVVASDRDIVTKRVALFEEYKEFIDQQCYAEHFDSRSNLQSSVLEEFIYYLFRDVVKEFGDKALIGKSHAFKDIFFAPTNYSEMIARPNASVEIKDHDFVIGVTIEAKMRTVSDNDLVLDDEIQVCTFDIPAVVIECKTYLDKTMLEGASRAAEELKARNPNAIYIVVMEWVKLSDAINFQKYKVDQIYVLRKQKNTDREYRFLPDYDKNPIYPEVVWNLFNMVRNHLSADWQHGIQQGLERGWLIE